MILVWIFMMISLTYGQTTSESGLGVVDIIKMKALNSKEGVPGEIIAKDMNPVVNTTFEDECPGDKKEDDKKKELVLIFTGEINTKSEVKVNGKRVDLPDLEYFDSSSPEYKDLFSKSSDKIWGLANALGQQNQVDEITNLGILLVLGASQMYVPDKVNDKDYNASVNQIMADKIKALNLNRDQQIQLIASMSEVLYANYNDPRNVTPQSDNDPRYWTAQAHGVFSQSPNSGGVCDDISFLGCQLYSALNPKEDCLTMHSSGYGGTQHFVMMLGSQGTRNYTTINGNYIEKTQGSNYISMDPASPTGADGGINIRLNGIVDGKHKSFSVLKNEYGQWMQKVMQQPGAPGSTIVSDIDGALLQNLGAAFEKHKSSENEKYETTKKYGVNHGVLSNGTQMVAVYALIDKTTPKKKVGIGVGYNFGSLNKSGVNFSGTDIYLQDTLKWNYQVKYENDLHRIHLNPYFGIGNIHKFSHGNSEIKLHYLNGVYANFLLGYQGIEQNSTLTETLKNPQGEIIDQVINQDNQSYGGIIFDGNLGLSQKVSLDISNKKGTDVKVGMQFTQELGPSDWNRVHGLRSNFFEGIKKMTFFLNRVELKGQVDQKINDKKTLMAGVQYLGTNVGQNLFTQLGFKFQIPKDMELYILTGYGAELGGYKTNQNYLPVSNNSGISFKAGVVSPGGLSVGAGVRYDQNSVQPVSTQLNATIPIRSKKKKKP